PSPGRSSARATTPGAPTVVASGLEVPWGLAFLPGGDALVSERESGRVLRIPAAGGGPVEVRRLDGVRARGEGGLLGLAVAPDSPTTVYAYYTSGEDNRVVRFGLDGGPVVPVLTGIPDGTIHNGGRLAFGPDGNLYVGTGDTGERSLAQDPDSLGGKVLRVTPDGGPVEGTRVFSSGHRNVQGLAFDDAGRLWATEFGQNTYDEVNLVREGDNGGWPEVEGPGDGGGRFAAPLVVWDTSEASPSGAAVAGGSLYVAALRGERLWRVPLYGDRTGEPEALLREEFGRLRTVVTAPDGSLWVTTSNRDGRGDPGPDDDRVLRIPLGA
ncbi:MAG: PQQ-dependent sugar dehydrogenase, partial [Actinomycetota bacterium]|nr:PQQ-dependent sugar dehydrogenase [Actinomycetota bacterium]